LAERYDDAERLVQQPHAQMEADSYATGGRRILPNRWRSWVAIRAAEKFRAVGGNLPHAGASDPDRGAPAVAGALRSGEMPPARA
jgi:hypothetical protein